MVRPATLGAAELEPCGADPVALRHPVEGADFDTVGWCYERDGAVEGNATIYGRWLGDRITVHHQTPQLPQTVRASWSDPPCPAPAGGWPRSREQNLPENLHVDLGDLEETGAAVTVVIFRPSTDQALLVIAAGDIAAVEAQLRPQLADRLCVVASRWTGEQQNRRNARSPAMKNCVALTETVADSRSAAAINLVPSHQPGRWVTSQPRTGARGSHSRGQYPPPSPVRQAGRLCCPIP